MYFQICLTFCRKTVNLQNTADLRTCIPARKQKEENGKGIMKMVKRKKSVGNKGKWEFGKYYSGSNVKSSIRIFLFFHSIFDIFSDFNLSGIHKSNFLLSALCYATELDSEQLHYKLIINICFLNWEIFPNVPSCKIKICT